MSFLKHLENPLALFRMAREGGSICDLLPNLAFRELRRHGYYFEPIIVVLALFIIFESNIFWQVTVVAGLLISLTKRMIFYAGIRSMFTDDEFQAMIVLFEQKLKDNESDYTEEALEEIMQQCDDRYIRYSERRKRKQAMGIDDTTEGN